MEETQKVERKGTRFSLVWEFFLIVDDIYAMCKTCNQKISYKTTVTNLRRHMIRRHLEVYYSHMNDNSDPEQESETVIENENEEQNELPIHIEDIKILPSEIENCPTDSEPLLKRLKFGTTPEPTEYPDQSTAIAESNCYTEIPEFPKRSTSRTTYERGEVPEPCEYPQRSSIKTIFERDGFAETPEYSKRGNVRTIYERDEFTVFGEYVANRLRKILDPRQRLMAEHKINEMLFAVEMENYK